MYNWWKNLSKKTRSYILCGNFLLVILFIGLDVLIGNAFSALLFALSAISLFILIVIDQKVEKEDKVKQETTAEKQSVVHVTAATVPQRAEPSPPSATIRYGHAICEILFDYCIIDIETTGFDPKSDKIIEITALRVRNNKVQDKFTSFVNAPTPLPSEIKDLTGITDEMVANAPPIEEIMPKFLEFVGEDVIIGHNITFDLRFISANTTALYSTPFFNDYLDTLTLSRKVFRNFNCHKLSYLAEKLSLPRPAHRAEADCITTKALYDLLWHTALSCKLSVFYPNQRFDGRLAEIVPTVDRFDETHPLYGKVCAISGKLPIDRTYAMQQIADRGGINTSTVGKKTNILVAENADDTAKYRKAKELIELGQPIQIIDAEQFINMLLL